MSFQYPEGRILVFAKAPVPGEVKTRLQPRLSIDQCARLQQQLIEHTLRTCVGSNLCAVELWCAMNTQHAFFQDCRQRYPVELQVQKGGDLGARMLNALEHALQRAQFVLIVGTDCPALNSIHLHTAAKTLQAESGVRRSPGNRRLQDHVVFIPAEDGGYVLLGATCAPPALTGNIKWGGDKVMEQSRRNLTQANIEFTELDPLWDVDRPEDLDRLQTLASARDFIEIMAP